MENINQKKVILDYLETAYAGAEAMHDEEIVCRLTRAIIAFSYDDLENLPSWEEMFKAYTNKK